MSTHPIRSRVLSTVLLGLASTALLGACDLASHDGGDARDALHNQQSDGEKPLQLGDCVADLEGNTLELWPPNHKMHTVTVADCVTVSDECADHVQLMFTSASSDEPVDDKGDGHHAPDILVDNCETVQVRAERAGPRNARFYTLNWLAEDDAGEQAAGSCQVVVRHDKGPHEPVDDGPAYTVDIGDDFEDCDEGDDDDADDDDDDADDDDDDADDDDDDTGDDDDATGDDDDAGDDDDSDPPE